MAIGTADKTVQATGEAQDKPKDLSALDTGLDSEKGGAKPEKTYSQSEVNAQLGKAGQKLQASNTLLTAERDTFKSQAESLTAEMTEARESITSLTKEIDAMSEDNPDKDAVVKLRKEREKELIALKRERAEIAPQKQEIAKWNRDQLVYTVADEFVTADGKDVDFDAFMAAADRLKLNEREGPETLREGLVALAETMGLKPKAEVLTNPEIPLVFPSGKTSGGGINFDDMTPEQKREYGRAHPDKKMR